MIWSKVETLSRKEIEEIQLERLKETVHRVYNNVPAYRKKMDDAKVKPEDIVTLKDLSKLILILDMYIGRLELIPFLVLFQKDMWILKK